MVVVRDAAKRAWLSVRQDGRPRGGGEHVSDRDVRPEGVRHSVGVGIDTMATREKSNCQYGARW